jgi:hypothetical protein
MTCGPRAQLVKVRTDLILGGERAAEVYAAHFETQLHRGPVRRWLHVICGHFARAGGVMFSVYPEGIWYSEGIW